MNFSPRPEPPPDFTVFLVGNPNTGKTTLFNRLTGEEKKIGNLAGVTVTREETVVALGNYPRVRIVDLPGIYSLAGESADEKVAISAFFDSPPDVIVNVVDAGNLERNLYLTLQLTELKIPMLLVLNMEDAAAQAGVTVDAGKLSAILRIPVISSGKKTPAEMEAIKSRILDVHETGAIPLIESDEYLDAYSLLDILREAEFRFSGLLQENREKMTHPLTLSTEGITIRLLEKDAFFIAQMRKRYPFFQEIEDRVNHLIRNLEEKLGDSAEIIIAENRYRRVAEIFQQVTEKNERKPSASRYYLSDRIDAVLTNRFSGIPFFMAIMFCVFTLTFTLGEWPVAWISHGMDWLRGAVVNVWGGEENESLLCSLVADGLIGGVGGILVFLPNVMLVFFFISLLEATGYLARVAFLMDSLMRKLCGLEGKSIIPLLVGFGCNVPGLMATRTITSARSRLITILVLPLMSCGGRLPIYTLLAGALIAPGFQAPAVLGVYMLGIVLVFFAARVLSLLIGPGTEHGETTIVELPPYQVPPMKNLLVQVGNYTVQFLVNAGTFLLAGAILLWAIGVFPKKTEFSRDFDGKVAQIQQEMAWIVEVTVGDIPANVLAEKQDEIREIRRLREEERYDFTLAGRIGGFLEPVFKPLGFDKKITLAALGGIAAKELFVSQMQILYGGARDDDMQTAQENAAAEMRSALRKHYTTLQGICVMVFALIGTPCVAVVATVRQETKSTKIAILQWAGLTIFAWCLTLVIYQGGRFLVFSF